MLNFKKLTHLNISNNNVSNLSLLVNSEHLEELEIQNNSLHELTLLEYETELFVLSELEFLRKLSIGSFNLDEEKVSYLKNYLENFTYIEVKFFINENNSDE